MSNSLIGPNVAQLKHIIAYLKKVPPEIARRGSALAGRRAVMRLWWESEDSLLAAKVQGSYLYTQNIAFGRKGISLTECTCPYDDECKHIAAALIAFSKHWSGDGPDLKGEDEDYYEELTDADDDEDFPEDEDEDEEEADQPYTPNPILPPRPKPSPKPWRRGSAANLPPPSRSALP
jgi:hypothetical protein